MKDDPSNIWFEIIKVRDLGYLKFLLEEWYIDNLRWRIEHHLLGQRCENCRNWHFEGRFAGRGCGLCDLEHHCYDYHDWCPIWNMDFNIDERGYTTSEDGWERVTVTPAGKKITQVSKSGIWMYKHDGEMKW